jgi:hypothetical protein
MRPAPVPPCQVWGLGRVSAWAGAPVDRWATAPPRRPDRERRWHIGGARGGSFFSKSTQPPCHLCRNLLTLPLSTPVTHRLAGNEVGGRDGVATHTVCRAPREGRPPAPTAAAAGRTRADDMEKENKESLMLPGRGRVEERVTGSRAPGAGGRAGGCVCERGACGDAKKKECDDHIGPLLLWLFFSWLRSSFSSCLRAPPPREREPAHPPTHPTHAQLVPPLQHASPSPHLFGRLLFRVGPRASVGVALP